MCTRRAGDQRIGRMNRSPEGGEVGLVPAGAAGSLPVGDEESKPAGFSPRSTSAMFTQVVPSMCPSPSRRRRPLAIDGVSRR